MAKHLEFKKLKSSEIEPYVDALGALRISVFKDWPYIYEGDLSYERKYLKKYIQSQNSFALLVFDGHQLVGATTAILLDDESMDVQSPLIREGLSPQETVYFGESLLLHGYRGQGVGKKFMTERMAFASSYPYVKQVVFCSVIRPSHHEKKPQNYKPLDAFWEDQGFLPMPDVRAKMSWLDIGEKCETEKQLQFWKKSLI